MKLKSFGLIEAMIASAVLIIFLSAMALLSVRASQSVEHSIRLHTAQKIADDYIGRLMLLRNSGRIGFGGESNSGQTIPIDCFKTEKGEGCKGSIIDSYPQNRFPFFDMISSDKIGNYYLLNAEYQKIFPNDFFKIKAGLISVECRFNKPGQFPDKNCYSLLIEVLWPEKNSTGKYQVSQYLTDWI